MARVTVDLPDDLAAEARKAGLNVSSITQDALRRALAARGTSQWVESLSVLPPVEVSHEEIIAALHAVRDEMGPGAG